MGSVLRFRVGVTALSMVSHRTPRATDVPSAVRRPSVEFLTEGRDALPCDPSEDGARDGIGRHDREVRETEPAMSAHEGLEAFRRRNILLRLGPDRPADRRGITTRLAACSVEGCDALG